MTTGGFINHGGDDSIINEENLCPSAIYFSGL